MSALPKPLRMTEAEYLEFERASETKHEYIGGEVFAMTGASRHHNLITGATYASLFLQLRGRPCEVYPGDMRVQVRASGLYTYPDIGVVCGEAQLADTHLDTLINPLLIVEVLSPSTELYDRGRKFQYYRHIESLREYVLIAQDAPRIERFVRQGDVWQFSDAVGLDASLELPSIGCTLALADVYEQVTFEAEETPPALNDESKTGE
jgi:Uma2 family endonuclease